MNLLHISFCGAVMILAILAVRAVAINKLPKKAFLLFWEIVLMRLLLPFSVPSVFSVYSLVNRQKPASDRLSGAPAANIIAQGAEAQSGIPNGLEQLLQTEGMQDGGQILLWYLVWCAGFLLCATVFVATYLHGYLEFRTSLPVHNEFVSGWLKEHSLKRPVQIRQSDRISTPLTYGIFRPVILLPQNTDWENRRQLQYVLLHEYLHIRRYDMVSKLVAALALCIHWFNPMVWVMYVLFNRDMELVCDEYVVRMSGEDSKALYARTLIAMEEKRSGFMPFCNNFSKNAIEERITAIMKTKKATIETLVISALVLAAVVVFFATDAPNEYGVPDVVAQAAGEWVEGEYQRALERGAYEGGIIDWRIKSLEQVYTYEDLEGMTLQVYRLNHEFLAARPKSVTLAGGMSIDEEGWMVPDYPNSRYLIFRQEGRKLSYLMTLFENDCFPGDEIFTDDLRLALSLRNEYAAGYIEKIFYGSVTVDPVEYIPEENGSYHINNPDSTAVKWKLTEETTYTFLDRDGSYTGLDHPEYYTTTDRVAFEQYLKSYNREEPEMPFFFIQSDGRVKGITEQPQP